MKTLDKQDRTCYLVLMNNNNHPTRTYRSKPACAGSAAESVTDSRGYTACAVCGRTGLSCIIDGSGWTTRINTHLHPQDMASKPKTFTEPVAAPKPPWRPNPAQALAIQAFYANPSMETFSEMAATGATDEHYTTWARSQGMVTI